MPPHRASPTLVVPAGFVGGILRWDLLLRPAFSEPQKKKPPGAGHAFEQATGPCAAPPHHPCRFPGREFQPAPPAEGLRCEPTPRDHPPTGAPIRPPLEADPEPLECVTLVILIWAAPRLLPHVGAPGGDLLESGAILCHLFGGPLNGEPLPGSLGGRAGECVATLCAPCRVEMPLLQAMLVGTPPGLSPSWGSRWTARPPRKCGLL